MQVAKWGNSLAVRLPATVVREMNLKPGDEVEIQPRGPRVLEIALDAEEQAERDRRMKALAALRELAVELPPDYKFNREELYVRGRMEKDGIPG